MSTRSSRRAPASLCFVLALVGCHAREQLASTAPGRWTGVDGGAGRGGAIGDAATHDAVAVHDAFVAHDALGALDAGRRDAASRDAAIEGAARDASTIDLGSGRCGSLPVTLCTPYACDVDAGQCKTACLTSADCQPGFPCTAGRCGSPGDITGICTSNSDCLTDICSDGVCCTTACAGPCESCALTGRVGTCTPVPAGTDPRHQCPSGCGADGACIAPSDGAAAP